MTRDQPKRDEEGGRALHARLRALRVFEGPLGRFDVVLAPEHPAELFLAWLEEAIEAGVREPHAMTLATVDPDGRPSSRTLILKGLADGRWEFASSGLSRKGRELAANPWAALNFYWSEQGRQVRVRGRVLASGDSRSAADFLARSPEARAAALAGPQSAILESRQELGEAHRESQARLREEPELVADGWRHYGVGADEVEFFQAHPERRHVRLRYRLREGLWVREQLWP